MSALGIFLDVPVFPAVANCPLCQQNTLHLFDDTVEHGLWLHCTACARHGDIITFGAAIWNTSITETLDKLADLGYINYAEKELATPTYMRHIHRRKVIEEFWETAAEQLWAHGDDIIACRLRDLGVYLELDAANADLTPRRLIGVATRRQITTFCTAMARPAPKQARKNCPSLVMPYYDFPGRLTGVLITQYSEDGAPRRNFIALSAIRRRRPDAGYYMLNTAITAAPSVLRNTQIILDDPFLALAAQHTQLRHNLPLLPIMASYCGPEANSYGTSWAAFPTTPRLFQSNTVTPEIISQAAAARGYVSIASVTYKQVRYAILTRLAYIRTRAQTWQVALSNALIGQSDIVSYSFATRLTVPGAKLYKFFKPIEDKFVPGFIDRVLSVAAIRSPNDDEPRERKPKWSVIPRATSWYSRAGQMVCSANIIITKVLQADTGARTYIGVIYHATGSIDFADSAQKIESIGLLRFVQIHAATHNVNISIDQAWNKRAHLFALELYQPELILISNKRGWDENSETFKFANYAINNIGEVVGEFMLPQQNRSAAFPVPVAVAPPAIHRFLTSSPENAFVWTVFSAIVADLIAPILRKDATATAIPGTNFNVAAKIGAALQCDMFQSSLLNRKASPRHLTEICATTSWPVFILNAFDDTLFSPAVPHCRTLPALVKLAEDVAAIAVGYNWQVVRGQAPGFSTDFSALRYVLPAYIQRALSRRMGLAAQQKNITLAVMADLHAWLLETYQVSFSLKHATEQLITADSAHITLMETLADAMQFGKIALLPRRRMASQSYMYVLRQKDHWWINRRAIDSYAHFAKIGLPNWLAIVDLLIAEGVFAGEETIHKSTGIFVKASWCDKFCVSQDSPRALEIG